MNLSNEEIAAIFGMYFPNVEVMCPDGVGKLVGLPMSINQYDRVRIHFGRIVKTKNSIDGGYNKERNYGDYSIREQSYVPLKSPANAQPEFTVPGGVKMLLKPLSKITDQHALQIAVTEGLANATVFERLDDRIILIDDSYRLAIYFNGVIDLIKGNEDVNQWLSTISIIDQLRRWGYALPYKGQSLFDLGIALDKTINLIDPIIRLINDFYAISVPSNAYKAKIAGKTLEGYKDTGAIYWDRELDAEYEFMFLTNSATEEQMAGIVEIMDYQQINKVYKEQVFKRYGNIRAGGVYICETALESFNSLLQSKNLKGNFAVLKKINQ